MKKEVSNNNQIYIFFWGAILPKFIFDIYFKLQMQSYHNC